LSGVNGRRSSGLEGLRVLVVEDSFLIATSLQHMLTDLECKVIGPAATVAEAREQIARAGREIDAAILDIALSHEDSTPLARELLALDVPFTFLTGYDAPRMLPADLQAVPCLRKPVEPDMLRNALRELLQRCN
jgi:DNA-binding response OmpR family regulator